MKTKLKILLLFAFVLLIHLTYGQNSYDRIDWCITLDPDNDGSNTTDAYYNEQAEQVLVQQNANEEPEFIYVIGRTYSTVKGNDFMICGITSMDIGNDGGDVFVACYYASQWPVAEICGSLKWVTYLGSDDDEDYDYGYCMTLHYIDDVPKLFIGGTMNNNANQASDCGGCNQGIYQDYNHSDKEAFIARLDCETGSIEGWTFFGGSVDGKDAVDEILSITSYGDNIYFCGYTESKLNMPSGSTDPAALPGDDGDGFFAAMDECLKDVVLFSFYNVNYVSGINPPNGQDRCHSIKVYGDGDDTYIVLSGTTESNQGIATSDAWDHSYAGTDAFIGKWKVDVNGDLTVVYSTYIGGDDEEHGRQLALDDQNNLFATGYTRSDESTFKVVCSGYIYQYGIEGQMDGYVAKIPVGSTDGTPAWLTYFGGQKMDLPNDIKWFYDDNSEKAYVAIAGYTNSEEWHAPPDNPSMDNKINDDGTGGGNYDAFVAILEDIDCSDTQTFPFSTFIGGEFDERWTDVLAYGPYIDFGPNRELYISFTGYSDDVYGGMDLNCNCFDHMSVDYHNDYPYDNNTYTDVFLMKLINTNFSMDDCSYFEHRNSENKIESQQIRVYPNPASSELSVQSNLDAESYKIVDLTGRELMSKNVSIHQNKAFNINVSTLPSGLYLLKIYSTNAESVSIFCIDR